MEPFTIQLIYGSSGYRQAVNLGVDVGYENVGMSAIAGKKELYCSMIELRNDIPKLLTERRTFRRSRRNRKTRYRQPRFLNRTSSRKEDRLTPSVQHKLDTHIRLITRITKILPVTRVIVEKAKFDIARINNPEWEGKDFQHGPKYKYENLKTYIRDRDGYRCRNCGDDNVKLEVHHIVPKKQGGSDKPDNLLTLCENCHEKHHKEEIKLKIKKPTVHKEMSIMNVLSAKLSQIYEVTFGYITKLKRIGQELEKNHTNDAFIIAGGTRDVTRLNCIVVQKQVRKNNRKLFKGHRSEISNKCINEVFGYRLFDKVAYEGNKYFVWGRRKSGSFLLRNFTGTKIERSYKKLKKIKGRTSFLTEIHSLSG